MYKFGVFAYGDVGAAAVRIFREHKEQLKFVLLDKINFWDKNELILEELKLFPDTQVFYYEDEKQLLELCKGMDAIILAWWGRLIRSDLLNIPTYGFINLHTSYLPYGKGKHPHYWSLVEESPYGVTIMKIDEKLDTGAILCQKEVEKSWEDTGKTLYFKGIETMCELLEEKKEQLLNLEFEEKAQNITEGSFHYGKEIDIDSQIMLDKAYTARDLLNKIRARTFQPFPAAYFYENDTKYEVRINIQEVHEESEHIKIDYSKIGKD